MGLEQFKGQYVSNSKRSEYSEEELLELIKEFHAGREKCEW